MQHCAKGNERREYKGKEDMAPPYSTTCLAPPRCRWSQFFNVAVIVALVWICDSSRIPLAEAFTTSASSKCRLSIRHQGAYQHLQPPTKTASTSASSMPSTSLKSSYVPPEESDVFKTSTPTTKKKKSLHPKVGDLVRYYDLDGGKWDGEVLVGKISYISKQIKNDSNDESTTCPWLVEITEMDNLGDGYYAEYPSRINRMSKQTTRNLSKISPLSASFVRSENAYKVPLTTPTSISGKSDTPNMSPNLLLRQESYDWEDYEGPFASSTGDDAYKINMDVVQQDYELYQSLKGKLFKYTAISGLIGTIIANYSKGTEDAVIYFAGSVASLFYLFFLSLKTDTMASTTNPTAPKLGSKFSNLRFGMPVFLLLGIAIYNASRGQDNPFYNSNNPLDTVTSEQFAAAMIGFLTYRVPLFISQIQDAFAADKAAANLEDGGMNLPGSAGVALRALQQQQQSSEENAADAMSFVGEVIPVLLVSGPQATGRSELVQKLVEEGGGKFVTPITIDKNIDPVKFEQLQKSDDLLPVNMNGIGGDVIDNDPSHLRLGTTKDGILMAAAVAFEKAAAEAALSAEPDSSPKQRVVVVDASVPLAKKLVTKLGKQARLIGVWVGLTSVGEFEERLEKLIDDGIIPIPEDETRESVIRARIKEIVTEIEYGISSGIFEFTILNDGSGSDKALKELRDAANYCFK